MRLVQHNSHRDNRNPTVYTGFLPNRAEALPDRPRGFLIGRPGRLSSPPLLRPPLVFGLPSLLCASDEVVFAVGLIVTLDNGAGIDVGERGRGEPYEVRFPCE